MNQQQGRTSSGEEISQPSQIENFGPNVASEKVVVANFKGDYKEATNYYYKEVNKLYFANIVLNNQLKTIMDEKNALAAKVAKLEKQKGENGLMQDKKKRHRRTAGQIQRTFKCSVDNCQKSYGSEGSLSQHLKIKHPEYYRQITSMSDNPTCKGDRDDTQKEVDKGEQNSSP